MRGPRDWLLAGLFVGIGVGLSAGGTATPGYAGGGGDGSYTVLDVKTNNIKDSGTLIRVSVSYSCPAGARVLVQASLNGVNFVREVGGVVAVGSFGALDQEATCTGHRQKTELALPLPSVLAGGAFMPSDGVRALGFLREIPTSDEVHQGGPFVLSLHGPPLKVGKHAGKMAKMGKCSGAG